MALTCVLVRSWQPKTLPGAAKHVSFAIQTMGLNFGPLVRVLGPAQEVKEGSQAHKLGVGRTLPYAHGGQVPYSIYTPILGVDRIVSLKDP